MKKIAAILSVLALIGTCLPSLLFGAGTMALPTAKTLMLVSTVVWFIAAPLWMEHKVGE